jgi:hypothetical protein
MLSLISRFLAGVAGALLLLLGVEKGKVRKQGKVIEEQKQEITTARKQAQVNKTAVQAIQKAAVRDDTIQKEQKREEAKINETKATSETIAVANDVVSRFNARHRLPEHEGDTGTN